MKLKTWPDVWTFLRSIRVLTQKRSLGNDRFALRSLGQASCPRWGLVASCMFLGVSIYTSLFWLVGVFSRTSFSLPVGANQACIGREKKPRFSLFQATWILGNLNCWITPLVCTNQRCIERFFCPITIHVRFVQTNFWRLFFASKGCFAWSKPQGPSNFNNQGWIAAVEGCWQELNLTPKGFSMHFKGQTHLHVLRPNERLEKWA